MANARPINNIVSANAVSVNDVSFASGRSETQVNNASVASTEYWYEQSKYYAGQAANSASSASASAQIAINNAGLAELSANAAATAESNAEIWAEGTDEEVAELGGTHSSKGWVDYILKNAPTATVEETETGAIITVSDIIHGETTAELFNGAKGDKGDKVIQGRRVFKANKAYRVSREYKAKKGIKATRAIPVSKAYRVFRAKKAIRAIQAQPLR